MLPKISVTTKKASNKSCSELNFVKKNPCAYVYLPPLWSKGFERLIWLKYYTQRQIAFNLVLNADKNTD